VYTSELTKKISSHALRESGRRKEKMQRGEREDRKCSRKEARSSEGRRKALENLDYLPSQRARSSYFGLLRVCKLRGDEKGRRWGWRVKVLPASFLQHELDE